MTKTLDPADLAVLVRRGHTDPTTLRRLNMSLGASTVERELFEIGRSYDQMSTSLPDDAALLGQIVSRTLTHAGLPLSLQAPDTAGTTRAAGSNGDAGAPLPATLASAPVAGAGAKIAALGIAAIAIAGAYAGWRTWNPGRDASPQEQAVSVPTLPLSEAQEVSGLPPSGSSAVASAAVETPPLASAQPAIAESRVQAPRSDGTGTDAKSLFRDANSLRRKRNIEAAMSKYRQLQARFPNSAQAAVSHLILGQLLLSSGNPKEACVEFAAYRTRSPRGELAAEALQGQITCARRLGDRRLEAKACADLLSNFPDSAYAAAAKDRCGGGR